MKNKTAGVINFNYKGSKDDEFYIRQVFRMNETKDYIQGFDFAKLTPKERAYVKKIFKNRKVKNELASKSNPLPEKGELLKNIISKSWRVFKKGKENMNKCAVKFNGQEDGLKKALSKFASEKAIERLLDRKCKKIRLHGKPARGALTESFDYRGLKIRTTWAEHEVGFCGNVYYSANRKIILK